ncbi:PLDc N-terminal domain-containing protein [Nesterenkonia alba]|uniref:PLDc N-terminal domain-containing protein n=1 Tax=Nesterenkonia alba TaxID=515814 RepID=UPI0003B395B7|nr:PLDc N-terminal domain-containing protein [Nesterenkonia alba]
MEYVAENLSSLSTVAPMLPWWVNTLGIVYIAAMVAALMVFAQTRHRSPNGLLWVLVIVLLPILGALIYIGAQVIAYRSNPENPRPSKGRSETMAPEEVAEHQRQEEQQRQQHQRSRPGDKER